MEGASHAGCGTMPGLSCRRSRQKQETGAHMSNRTLRFFAAVSLCLAAGQAAMGELAGGEPLDYPHAGIAFIMPPGYQQQIVVEPFELAKAVLNISSQRVQAVTVSALPLADPSATPEDLAAGVLAAQSADLAIRNVQVINKAPMKAADMPGAASFISYTFRGEEMVAASAVFCRELPGRALRMQYVVTVEAKADRKPEVLPVLGDVVKSIRLLTVVRPIDIGVCQLGHPLEGPGGLYSFAMPHGWHVQPSPSGLAIAQTDYLLGGQTGLSAHVILADLPAGTSVRQHADNCVQAAINAAQHEGTVGTLVWQGPARLAGGEGWQIVCEQHLPAASPATHPTSAATASQAATTPAAEAAPQPSNVVFVQRSVALPTAEGKAGQRCLSLVLICSNASPQAADAVMEKLASGMVLHVAAPATTAPATQPATSAPAESQPAPPAAPQD